MGWTFTTARYFKNSLDVDRKAEIMNRLNTKEYDILRLVGVGSTYYAAMQSKETKEIFAAVILTRVGTYGSSKEFGYEMMDETWGPFETKCPKSILKMLTPTSNKTAKSGDKNAGNTLPKKKLSDLPIGSKIEVNWGDSTRQFTKGLRKGKPIWLGIEPDGQLCRISSVALNRIGWRVSRKAV